VLFAPCVRLSKTEVFTACQVLADADRCLVRSGALREAGALVDLFELLEERLSLDDSAVDERRPAQCGSGAASPAGSWSGSNSMESEFTQ
jgi:hypothetical protein